MTSPWSSSGTDICLPVKVEVEKAVTDVDALSVGLAFFFGVIGGALITLLCAKLCLKDIARCKQLDAEDGYMRRNSIPAHQKQTLYDDTSQAKKTSRKVKKKNVLRRRMMMSAKKKREENAAETLAPIVPISLNENQTTADTDKLDDDNTEQEFTNRGIVDALMLADEAAMEAEMFNQDLDAVNNLEREMREESLMTMIQMTRTLLNAEMQKGQIKPEEYQDMVKQVQDNVEDIINTCQRERDDEEEALRKQIKDPEKLEREIENLHPKYVQKMNSLVQDEKERLRQELGKRTDLKEDEIEALMAKLADGIARAEENLSSERKRQAAHLEERLQRRRHLASMHVQEQNELEKEIQHRQDTHDGTLQKLVDDGKILDRQKHEILDQYAEDLERIKMKHDEEYQRQKLAAAEKLRRHRENRVKQQEQQHQKEREDFLKKTDRGMDTRNLVDSYHDLIRQQRNENNELTVEMDQREVEEFTKLQKTIVEKRKTELSQADVTVEGWLQNKAGVSQKDIDRIMKTHQQEVEDFERRQKAERRRMKAMMEEKLAKRKAKTEIERNLTLAQEQALRDQQDSTVKNVIASQVDIADEAKKKIMKEHEQNMTAINNQLHMSKLRQQKSLESKLAAKRAKLKNLKKQAEEARTTKKGMKQKEREKLQQKMDKEIAEEEKKLEEEKKTAVSDLQTRIAAETEAAIKEEERRLGLLIARLQVGQARRQAVIQKQDKVIKELEDQLASRVEKDPVVSSDSRKIDYLIQQHYGQVNALNDKLVEAKTKQEQILYEKLQSKKLKKQSDIESKIEDEAQGEWEKQKLRGAGIATSILSQTLLEQRHKMAMAQLDRDMQSELQKQREDLNTELEEVLEAELQEQRKAFLAQIAAITNISKQEVNELVENAVVDSGGSEKQARKMAKEMNLEMRRAKTELGMVDDEPSGSLRRSRMAYTDSYDEPDYSSRRRPLSAKKKTTKRVRMADDIGYSSDF